MELADSNNFDLAVLDIKMPRISGIELKRRLHQKYPSMKFIFLTGHGSEDDYRTGAAEAGSENYLVKPVRIEALVRKMKNVLAT
jgi:DNA-binding response OmpR family regulator